MEIVHLWTAVDHLLLSFHNIYTAVDLYTGVEVLRSNLQY